MNPLCCISWQRRDKVDLIREPGSHHLADVAIVDVRPKLRSNLPTGRHPRPMIPSVDVGNHFLRYRRCPRTDRLGVAVEERPDPRRTLDRPVPQVRDNVADMSGDLTQSPRVALFDLPGLQEQVDRRLRRGGPVHRQRREAEYRVDRMHRHRRPSPASAVRLPPRRSSPA